MGIGVTDGIDRTELERLSANSRPGTYRLCTGSIDGMIRVLGFQSDPEANAKSAITAARLSSDGQYVLLAGGEDSDTFNMLPSCFMQGQRNESKAGTFRNRLASTAVIHRQESIELINDLVLGASKMRNKSEIAWEASTMSLAANGKHGRSISMMTTREDVKDNKRTKSAVQLSPSTKPSSPIPGEESGARGDSVLKADNLASSHLSMYDLTTRTVETTMVSMYEVATGKLICSFSTRGDIIWCDFDKNSDWQHQIHSYR
ncbi:hypothetical protein BC829DRAFT_180244 [Chytridium lagenaria]|nr:hypothetical protein BC829DRAFT_180244 [Chytridium lagenaria]